MIATGNWSDFVYLQQGVPLFYFQREFYMLWIWILKLKTDPMADDLVMITVRLELGIEVFKL